jgi:hypothetical protein
MIIAENKVYSEELNANIFTLDALSAKEFAADLLRAVEEANDHGGSFSVTVLSPEAKQTIFLVKAET